MPYSVYGIAAEPPKFLQRFDQCFARGLVQEIIVGQQRGLDVLRDWSCKVFQGHFGKIKQLRISGGQNVIVLDLVITGDCADKGVGVERIFGLLIPTVLLKRKPILN